MEKDVAKRESISRQLIEQPDLDWEIVNAVEGRKLNAEEIGVRADMDSFIGHYGKFATLPALGCAISHCEVYKKMLADKDNSYALILEDDAILSHNIGNRICQYANYLEPDSPVVILLTPAFFFRKSDALQSGLYKVLDGYMASGYLVNRKAAELILKLQFPIKYVADDWREFARNGLNLYGVTPNMISFKDGLGEIGRSQHASNTLWGMIKLTLGRFKVKYSQWQLSRKGIVYAKKYWK